ncbi:MAG: mandelate racemase [Hyphomicrobiales bacterium]|nr:mandelate racemase [Hyphomicrobiales bacterium]MCP5373724.1 mandelate racemase [Hyphomicrobiales bacterium]
MTLPTLQVLDVEARERDVTLRMPFKFGIVTLREAPQLFLRVTLRLGDGREGRGYAAETLAPKWFDKNPDLSNEQNFQQLRDAVAVAAGLYRGAGAPATAYGLHADMADAHLAACAGRDLNPLVAGFGTALVDRAVIDGLGRLLERSAFQMVADNTLGIDGRTAPDLAGFDLAGFLAARRPADSIGARHTVGLVDAITEADIAPADRVGDGLPESLEAAVDFYGLTHFKLKVGGDIDADLDRLRAIAAVLDRAPDPYWATLDGNEQYGSVEPVIDLWRRMQADPALARLCDAVLFIEQPIKRAEALAHDVSALAALKPVEIDESDATMATFAQARELGYTGVSSKSCKGFYRSLLNRARVAKWNGEAGAERFFMSAEDLTTQAGLCVQQDLALATLIGCTHVERNGHHYVNGMEGVAADEQKAFLAAHGDLYHAAGGVARLTITGGQIALGSLRTPGLGSAVVPDFAAMRAVDLGS